VAAFSVAVLPNSGHLAFENGTNMITLLVGRGLIGTVVLTILMFLTRSQFKLSQMNLIRSVISGCASIGFVFCVYSAILHIDIGIATLILYLYPIAIAVISYFLGKATLSFIQIVSIGAVLIGLALLVVGGEGSVFVVGILFAFASMLFTVVIVFQVGALTEDMGLMPANFYMTLWSSIILMLAVPFTNGLMMPQNVNALLGVGLNGVFYIFAWLAFFAGVQRIGLVRASVLSSIDPLFAALMALLLFNQTLGGVQWVGFGLVLLSLAVFELNKKQKTP
jgi:drug/metabolite transporter (DMT)-like permease